MTKGRSLLCATKRSHLTLCAYARARLRGELRPHRRQLANRAAKRLDLVMRVVSVHFRRCMPGKLLSDFDRHSGVRHEACKGVAEAVK